jgi:hypothetical protein
MLFITLPVSTAIPALQGMTYVLPNWCAEDSNGFILEMVLFSGCTARVRITQCSDWLLVPQSGFVRWGQLSQYSHWLLAGQLVFLLEMSWGRSGSSDWLDIHGFITKSRPRQQSWYNDLLLVWLRVQLEVVRWSSTLSIATGYWLVCMWHETAPTNGPTVTTPVDRQVWSSRWNENWRGATSSTTNPTWPHLESNLGCHCEKLATNYLSCVCVHGWDTFAHHCYFLCKYITPMIKPVNYFLVTI